ncbi:MAG: matrixin family metalloprotease [Nitrososphaeraceae archaeon]|nr:matrixin family metalloprotease [Nitrososphaeraceae archaeon]
MRMKYNIIFAFSFSTPCLLLALILLSSSVIPSATIISSSIPVMASVDDNQGDDDDNSKENTRDNDEDDDDTNDDIDLDELNLLQICCAWSDKILDGALEYRISDEGDEDSKQSIRNAIQNWDLLIDNLIFVEKQDDSSNEADVEIGFSDSDEDANDEEFDYGGPVAAGKTEFIFDNKGFIDSIEVTLSGGIFGNRFQNSELEQIARHEIGHVLGLGHANFDGNLMSESTDGGTENISTCEINGVLAANYWRLVDAGNNPEYPEAHFVVC